MTSDTISQVAFSQLEGSLVGGFKKQKSVLNGMYAKILRDPWWCPLREDFIFGIGNRQLVPSQDLFARQSVILEQVYVIGYIAMKQSQQWMTHLFSLFSTSR